MSATASSLAALEALTFARLIATHAERIGCHSGAIISRDPVNHLGAALADSTLQTGLKYNTVVRPRVDRIRQLFPEAATLSGVFHSIERVGLTDFLLWRHPAKLERFVGLIGILREHDVESVAQLQSWLLNLSCRKKLLSVHGIGPKTVDYLCALVGLDCVAVDRHVRTFARAAGVTIADYDSLQVVVSYAADLLGVPRRAFDSWIWRYVSEGPGNSSRHCGAE
jgi:hypothetical protein